MSWPRGQQRLTTCLWITVIGGLLSAALFNSRAEARAAVDSSQRSYRMLSAHDDPDLSFDFKFWQRRSWNDSSGGWRIRTNSVLLDKRWQCLEPCTDRCPDPGQSAITKLQPDPAASAGFTLFTDVEDAHLISPQQQPSSLPDAPMLPAAIVLGKWVHRESLQRYAEISIGVGIRDFFAAETAVFDGRAQPSSTFFAEIRISTQ